MTERVWLKVEGRSVSVPEGATLLTAMLSLGFGLRRSPTGELRGPLCGMGICHECRVRVAGAVAVRACMVRARAGMEVRRDDDA